MTGSAPKNLSFSIFQVTSSDLSIQNWGTAFVVHHDKNHTYLLTCAHVVDDVGGKEKIRIAGLKANVKVYRDDLDAAVLKIEPIPDHPAIPLLVKRGNGGKFSSYGFSKLGTQLKKEPLRGEFGTSMSLHSRDKFNGHIAWNLAPDGSGSFQPGLSGSPVFCESGECVAMVAFKQGTSGIARSIELVREVLPEVVLADVEEGPISSEQNRDPRMNREEEIDAFARIMANRDLVTKVLVIEGEKGMGKTQLLTEYMEIASRYDWRIERKDFGGQITLDDTLETIQNVFGGRSKFPQYQDYKGQRRDMTDTEDARLLTQKFCNDLSTLRNEPPLLLMIDQYDKGYPLLKTLCDHFLQEIRSGLPLIAVVAGTEAPKLPYGENARWVRKFTLKPVTFECWIGHLQQRGYQESVEALRGYYDKAKGVPLFLSYVSLPLMARA